jgi:hypothetical protein
MFELEKKSTLIQTLSKGLTPHFRPQIDLFVGSAPHTRPFSTLSPHRQAADISIPYPYLLRLVSLVTAVDDFDAPHPRL